MFYPAKTEHENTFSYLVVDPIKRTATVFYHNFGASEFEWYIIHVPEFRNWLPYNRYDADVAQSKQYGDSSFSCHKEKCSDFRAKKSWKFTYSQLDKDSQNTALYLFSQLQYSV